MSKFDAVLFDYGHTLFDTTSDDVLGKLRKEFAVGADVDEAAYLAMWKQIWERSRLAEEIAKGRDLSESAHDKCWLELLAPLDSLAEGLAAATYRFQCSASGWQPYPDTAGVLAELRRRKVRVGVVSDCGWNIRQVFDAHDLAGFVDSFDLSYEHGVCKPDRRIFQSACSKLGVEPHKAVMVGDSWLSDGGAAGIGIVTLILPSRDRSDLPALSAVLDLVQ